MILDKNNYKLLFSNVEYKNSFKLDSNKVRKLNATLPKDTWCSKIIEYVWCIENNQHTQPICGNPKCNNIVTFKSRTAGYSKSCSSACSCKVPREKIRLTKNNWKSHSSINGKFKGKQSTLPSLDHSWAKTAAESYQCYKQNITSRPVCGFTHCDNSTNLSAGGYYHMCCSISCQRQASGLQQSMTKKEYVVFNNDKRKYYNLVRTLTEKQDIHLIPNIEMRGKYKTDYHLDHIFPISKGFEMNVIPIVIANISNLQMLPSQENIKKGSKWKSLEII